MHFHKMAYLYVIDISCDIFTILFELEGIFMKQFNHIFLLLFSTDLILIQCYSFHFLFSAFFLIFCSQKPPFFGQVDVTGNLRNGTLVAGISMTLISTFVPFTNLDDLISSGILVAFSMTNSSLLLLRQTSPEDSPFLLEVLLFVFHVLSFTLALSISRLQYSWMKLLCVIGLSLALVGVVSMIVLRCKESNSFGSSIPNDHDKLRNSCTTYITYFQVPCMPYLPLVGAFINWYLLAQLQLSALLLLLLYFMIAVTGYFSYGYHHSFGNTRGWDYNKREGLLVAHDRDKSAVDNENTFLQRVISMPQVGVRELT